MTLKPPNLDDRDFQQLLDEAKRIIVAECPQWTDLTPGDPGIVLLELFAHLTETMMFNGERCPFGENTERVLAEGDEIYLLAPLAGG